MGWTHHLYSTVTLPVRQNLLISWADHFWEPPTIIPSGCVTRSVSSGPLVNALGRFCTIKYLDCCALWNAHANTAGNTMTWRCHLLVSDYSRYRPDLLMNRELSCRAGSGHRFSQLVNHDGMTPADQAAQVAAGDAATNWVVWKTIADVCSLSPRNQRKQKSRVGPFPQRALSRRSGRRSWKWKC